MPSRDVIARFEAERQALALMDHQNIARALDAGTTESGQPFFVMELVSGVAITQYCDDSQLSPDQRLDLFSQACRAIQHAHQKGVIHRDIKPSNILVSEQDGKPTVKVIDFGLAKAIGEQIQLTDKTMFTHFGAVVGTLAYMSPEQAELNTVDIDTRTDVYSLGVILYELLTGSTPITQEQIHAEAFDRLMQKIREVDPPRASIRFGGSGDAIARISLNRSTNAKRLASMLSGDLDWIVVKALEKNRVRRYDTAASLADDVQRYLRGEAIEARPPTFVYRVKKFVSRNRLLASSVASLLLILAVGVAGTSWFAYRASLAARSERAQKKIANQKSAELETALLQSDTNLARSHFFLATARFNENRADLALKTLATIPESFRGLHWDFAMQKSTGGYQTLFGHKYAAKCVAFSPDGLTIASAGEGHEIRIWDAIRGEQLRVIQAHRHRIESLAFSPDGSQLASASYDKTVKVWDIETGSLKQTFLDLQAPVSSVAFHPDGKWIAAGCRQEIDELALRERKHVVKQQGSIKVWDLETRETIHTLRGHRNHVHSVEFSPDGKTLASSGMEIILWDAVSGEQQQKLKGHEFHIPSIAFSPDGKQLVSAGDRGKTAIIWDTESGRELHTLRGHSEFLTCATFSPDGSTVATASADRTIGLWDASSGKLKRTLAGHQNWVYGIAFSPSSEALVSASRDCTLKLWDLRTKDEFWSLSRRFALRGLSWCEKTRTFAIAGPIRDLEILSLDDPASSVTIETRHKREVKCVALSPDGKRVVSGGWDKSVRLWDASTGESIRELLSNSDSSISDVQFSPDGRFIAAAGSVVDVWDAETGKSIMTFDKHKKYVFAIAFSPDGRWLASGSADLTAKIWNPSTGEVRLTIDDHPFWVYDLAFNRDGHSLATASSGVVTQWDSMTGEKLRSYSHENVQRIEFVGESFLATADDSAGDSIVKLWDTASGEELLDLNGHTGRIEGLASGADGSFILSCGSDRTIKLWRPITQSVEHRLEVPLQFSIQSAVFDATGEKLLCLSRDGRKIAWDRRSRKQLVEETDFPEFDNLSNRTDDGHWLTIPGKGFVRLIDLSNRYNEPFEELIRDKTAAVQRVPPQIKATPAHALSED